MITYSMCNTLHPAACSTWRDTCLQGAVTAQNIQQGGPKNYTQLLGCTYTVNWCPETYAPGCPPPNQNVAPQAIHGSPHEQTLVSVYPCPTVHEPYCPIPAQQHQAATATQTLPPPSTYCPPPRFKGYQVPNAGHLQPLGGTGTAVCGKSYKCNYKHNVDYFGRALMPTQYTCAYPSPNYTRGRFGACIAGTYTA